MDVNLRSPCTRFRQEMIARLRHRYWKLLATHLAAPSGTAWRRLLPQGPAGRRRRSVAAAPQKTTGRSAWRGRWWPRGQDPWGHCSWPSRSWWTAATPCWRLDCGVFCVPLQTGESVRNGQQPRMEEQIAIPQTPLFDFCKNTTDKVDYTSFLKTQKATFHAIQNKLIFII